MGCCSFGLNAVKFLDVNLVVVLFGTEVTYVKDRQIVRSNDMLTGRNNGFDFGRAGAPL